MTGTEYIQNGMRNGTAKYHHLRAVLQELWNIYDYRPADRFDIDIEFKRDTRQLANYIINSGKFEAHNIDNAHKRMIEYYRTKGRGRPRGARNKNAIYNVNIDENVHTTNSIDLNIDNELGSEEQNQASDGDAKSSVDMRQVETLLREFITKRELNERKYVNQGDLKAVASNLDVAIRAYIDAENKKLDFNAPRVIELVRKDLPNLDLGVQHRCFKQLLVTVQATLRNGNRIIPWVYGPAGTGKSVASENVAKALDLPYHVMGTTLAKFEILGFVNTTGYQSTPFRDAYEHGGIFCADEMDSWAKEATVALNNGLANGHCTFPDKTVPRHPNFVMIACANTTGSGATLEFVGRNKQDGATLNRFVHIYWPLDEALENSMCANKDWLRYVRHVRARVANSNLNPKPLITPRATIFGESLLNAGLELETVIDMCLKQGISDAQWSQIK